VQRATELEKEYILSILRHLPAPGGDLPAKITIRNNGPVRIEGDFEIVDQDGRPFDLAGRTTISLCRCGQSSNKPFCDGTHKECGFDSAVEARALPPPAAKPA